MTKKQQSIASELIAGMKETLDFVQGKETGGKAYFVYGGQMLCVQEIREKLKMTREEFARHFMFKLNTVRNWEQGIRQPNGHTLAYLMLIAADPQGTHRKLKPMLHSVAAPA